MPEFMLISNVSDASFALGVAHSCSQPEDVADVVALKNFANSEFCPRFLLDDVNEANLGHGLKGKSVYIISTASPHYSRNELAMRNCLIARAAKENGAGCVALIEPDLFYSAQDRGPRTVQHPQMSDFQSRKKFVGQPCSALLYAQLLKESGVDLVMTVHNHKPDVIQGIYQDLFKKDEQSIPRCFINLDISHLVANYILRSGLARLDDYGAHVGFVAPDEGAMDFVSRVRKFTGLKNSVQVTIKKTRHGQRDVELESDYVESLKGRDVFVLDDMVRTGGTIAANIKLLAENENSRPANIFFYCTHTNISPEGRENLNSKYLGQFITTNTIPNILNRDDQGRLRKKTVVLKIEKWIANAILQCLQQNNYNPEEFYGISSVAMAGAWYEVDISSKNPRHRQPSRVAQYELMI